MELLADIAEKSKPTEDVKAIFAFVLDYLNDESYQSAYHEAIGAQTYANAYHHSVTVLTDIINDMVDSYDFHVSTVMRNYEHEGKKIPYFFHYSPEIDY